MNLGKAIAIIQKYKGLKQKDLSKKSGLSSSYLSNIRHNKKKPSFEALEDIASALEVSIPELIIVASEEFDFASSNHYFLSSLLKSQILINQE